MRRKHDASETPLEGHLETLISALRLYTASIVADDEAATNEAEGAVRVAAADFVADAHDAYGGWPNVFADLFDDEESCDENDLPDSKLGEDRFAVRARYDVTISDLPALLARGRELADGRPVDRPADALYELLHASPTPIAALHGVPGLKIVAGAYTFATVPEPLTFARMEASPVESLIEMEDGAEVVRSAADLPMFPSREAAESAAHRAARKHNLGG